MSAPRDPLDPARLTRLAWLADQALEHSDETRAPWLASLSPDDRRDALALLAADAQSPAFLGSDATRIGSRIGPYRLVAELGRGGMGVVYLGERDDDRFRQQVAIKLLPAALRSPERLSRFLQERRLLAALDHPNIARVIDAGEADGLPWFALDYVDGVPIDQADCGSRARVACVMEWLEQAARALAAAHARLVVHCDLKPANMLIDATGQVRLLDFGIARLLDEADGGDAGRPQRLTRDYAAPEQLAGGAVDVRTDLYALGRVGYVLLAGDPQQSLAETNASVPAQASLEALRTGRDPRIDADAIAILGRLLAHDPDHRYPSAEALIADLAARREHLPVAARRGGAAYRGRRWLYRHRFPALIGSLFVALLLVTAIGARQQASQARLAAGRAELARNFVAELFSRDGGAAGETIRATDLIARGLDRADRTFAGEPALRLEYRALLGGLYSRLGAHDEARSVLAETLAESARVIGASAPLTLSIRLDAVEAELAAGQGDAALGLLDELASGALPSALQARALALRGEAHRLQGSFAAAEASFTAAVALDRQHEDRDALARDLAYLGSLATSRRDPVEARARLEEALTIFDAGFGGDHPQVADLLHDLGNTATELGDLGAAIRHLQRSKVLYEAQFGKSHPAVAAIAAELGKLALRAGQPAEARVQFERALAIDENRFGNDHPRTIAAVDGLARSLAELGERDAARALVDDVHGRVADAASPAVARLELTRGALALSALDLPAAREAFSVAAQSLAGNDPEAAGLALRGAGISAWLAGDASLAFVDLTAADAALSGQLPPGHPDRLLLQADLANVASALGEQDPAKLLIASAGQNAAALPVGHPLRQRIAIARAWIALREDAVTEAEAALSEADAAADYAPFSAFERDLIRTGLAVRAGHCPGEPAMPDDPGLPPVLQQQLRDWIAGCSADPESGHQDPARIERPTPASPPT